MSFFDAHTHRVSREKNTLSIVNRYPTSTDFSMPFSIGIHPWFIHENKISAEILILQQKIQHKNCLAIGECGLDKLTKTDFKLQTAIFIQQIQLSEVYKKPVIIHCVKAHQEIIQLKKELKPTQIWVLHGFNKNYQVAESLLKHKIILSFGSSILKNKKLQEVVLRIPLDAILVETDDSEIKIQEIYTKIASIKQVKIEVLKKQIYTNLKKIFLT